jgi:glycerate 2-kinase
VRTVKIVICPDSFKGGPTAVEVARAIATGWRSVRPSDAIVEAPLADGGEGTLDAMQSCVPGAVRRTVAGVAGPDGRSVDADYVALPDGTAVVELAAASGLPLLRRLDPLGSTTLGSGQVIAAALEAGARRLLIGLGGSASTDGGAGLLVALGARFLDAHGRELPPGGGALVDLARVDLTDVRPAPSAGVEVLSDVTNPLLGTTGAAAVFGPQKGAGAEEVDRLEAGLTRLAELLGGDPDAPGAGAAGGSAYALATVWGARLVAGSQALADEVGLARAMQGADLTVTGEGRFDTTSLSGKVVSAVLSTAATEDLPVAIVAGAVDEAARRRLDGGVRIVSLSVIAGSSERSMAEPERYLVDAGARLAVEHRGAAGS